MKFLQYIEALLVIATLLILYNKLKEDNEDYFSLKLLGYYFLGLLNLTISRFSLPFGFALSLLAFKPIHNIRAKRIAALLGLVIFIIGLFAPKIDSHVPAIYQLPASSTNIFNVDFKSDWLNIQEELDVSYNSKVESFTIQRIPGGRPYIRYDIVAYENYSYLSYRVDLDLFTKSYKVMPSIKTGSVSSYPDMMDTLAFFDALEKISLELLLPADNYVSVDFSGYRRNVSMWDWDYYRLIDNEVIQLSNVTLPHSGYYFSLNRSDYGRNRIIFID